MLFLSLFVPRKNSNRTRNAKICQVLTKQVGANPKSVFKKLFWWICYFFTYGLDNTINNSIFNSVQIQSKINLQTVFIRDFSRKKSFAGTGIQTHDLLTEAFMPGHLRHFVLNYHTIKKWGLKLQPPGLMVTSRLRGPGFKSWYLKNYNVQSWC